MMYRVLRTCFMCLIGVVFSQKTNYRDVKIPQGPVRGYREGNIFGFYSILYATVPTGRDFYKEPLPPPSWKARFNATEQSIICPQPIKFADPPLNYQVKEQCLVVNIFVPISNNTDIPVVVYVHGGGFQIGSGNRITPKKLVGTGKVIAVTFNYRLGPQGFLCLGTDRVPGNAAMKDMVALLKWVQNNINHFGGNPNQVTIAGYSAGSAAVDVLLLSKMTDGLFNKVIIESGSNLNAFTVQTDPLENAKWFAKSLGSNNTNDTAALEEFYMNTPYAILSNHTGPLLTRTDTALVFSPCVENDVGQDIFLDKSPAKLLETGDFKKLPLLYGITEFEGVRRLSAAEKLIQKLNENFLNFIPQDIGHSKSDKIKLAELLKNLYFDNEIVSEKNFLKFIEFLSDCLIKYGSVRSARLQVNAGNYQIYFYVYKFVDSHQPYIPHTKIRGAKHCAQTHAVLDSMKTDENLLSDEIKRMKIVMRELWTNFIIYGKPVPEGYNFPAWPPMTSEISFMLLDKNSEYRKSLVYENLQFWDDIIKKYYKYPSAPNPNVDSSYIFPY